MNRFPAALAALALLPGLLAAAPGAPAPAPASRAGWVEAPASLLLRDAQGAVVHEIGLGSWREEQPDGSILLREMRGGIAPSRRFAWHWQKVSRVRPGPSGEVLASSATLAFLGTAGQLLWRNHRAMPPENVAPVHLSADGETALVIERVEQGWRAAAYSFTGGMLLATEPVARLERAAITPNGRYAMALGGGIDEALVYTFLDLDRRRTRKLPAAEAPLGRARITGDGKILLGDEGKEAFSFAGEADAPKP